MYLASFLLPGQNSPSDTKISSKASPLHRPLRKIRAVGVLLLKQDITDFSLICRLPQNPSILYALS